MPRISQVAMVLGTLGLCIAINTWRYPIVRQMIAQLPSWEFSIQPKQAEGIASAPVPPPSGETEQKKFHGSFSSPTFSPLSVGMPSPSLGNLPPATGRFQELSFGGDPSPRSTQPGDVSADTSPSEVPKEENPVPLPKGPASQQKESSSGTPVGLAERTPNSHPNETSSVNLLSSPPLVPLDTSGSSSKVANQNGHPPTSTDQRVVCTGSSCKLQSPPPETVSPAQTPGTGTPSGVPSCRARIIQVRTFPLDGENINNPAEGFHTTNNLLVPSTEKDDVHQNEGGFSSEEEKLELLPPVNPSVGGLCQGSRLPWPSGSVPFYPSTQPNSPNLAPSNSASRTLQIDDR